jgi:hypothetical protein
MAVSYARGALHLKRYDWEALRLTDQSNLACSTGLFRFSAMKESQSFVRRLSVRARSLRGEFDLLSHAANVVMLVFNCHGSTLYADRKRYFAAALPTTELTITYVGHGPPLEPIQT